MPYRSFRFVRPFSTTPDSGATMTRSASPLSALLMVGSMVLGMTTACGSDVITPGDDGGAGGKSLAPGEVCTTPTPQVVRVRAEPSFVIVAPCTGAVESCSKRQVNVVVDPDFCEDAAVTFESDNPDVVVAPPTGTIGLKQATIPLVITGGKTEGKATITVRVPKGDGEDATTTITVDVQNKDPIACSGDAATDALMGGDTLRGEGGLLGATIGLPEGANDPNSGSYLWSVDPFPADMLCADDLEMDGYLALGPAVSFGPEDSSFQREIPLSIPINPAILPDAARWRHLRIAYSGPAFKDPRFIPIADPRIEEVDGQWAVTFKAPRLGTYQALVHRDAGQSSKKRRLTHRAVIGVSMGGIGTSMFGVRHHDLFDVIAPLGGPGVWTWLNDYIERNHIGGFRPIEPGTTLAEIQLEKTECTTDTQCAADEVCLGILPDTPGRCTILQAPRDTYEHTQAFNNWWAEYPRTGTGGRFPRDEYAQIFRDLSLMFGNPNGQNFARGGEHLPAGVPPDDPSVVGDHEGSVCKIWVDPLDGPDKEAQQELAQNCPLERCKNTLTLQNYYDDEYNPDGTFPVITVCDGTPVTEALSPYANTWKPGENNYPLEVALAVDYNGNGVRDELEPIIRAGHEPWDDFGVDGIPSELEPGYAPGINDDPSGDDFHAQYNPTGTERDARYQEGETFYDYGLDGVPNTPQQPPFPLGYQKPGDGYDVGEGDGKFTVANGLQRMWDVDPTSIIKGISKDLPGGPLTDEALFRFDAWTDGGTRDLFNFGVSAQHLAGAFAARDRNVAYFTDFTQPLGLDPQTPNDFVPARLVYEDLPGIVMQRYGAIDPDEDDIENGSGQHVGTANQIASRLQTALYFIGSRWQEDPDLRYQIENIDGDSAYQGATQCEIIGNCAFDFEGSDGRVGPVSVTLPPGYAHKDLTERRYPVIYMLHGYGQTPEDLAAAIVFLKNWMNSPTDSMDSRLPKAILVYVDGRCRVGKNGEAECIRGTFYADSPREGGMQSETWWLELMDHIDQTYRTKGETEVDWVE